MDKSLAPTSSAKDVDVIALHSPRNAEREFELLLALFTGKETEDNWERREQALQRLRGILKGDSVSDDATHEAVALGVRKMLDAVLAATLSLRTALVVSACSALQDIITSLNTQLEPSIDHLITTLLKLVSQTKKLIHVSGAAAIIVAIKSCTVKPRILEKLAICVDDKNLQVRQYGMVFVQAILEKYRDQITEPLPKNALDIVERAIKKGVADANAQVRETSRVGFTIYCDINPLRADSLLQSFDAQTKKVMSRDSSKRLSQPSAVSRTSSYTETSSHSPKPKTINTSKLSTKSQQSPSPRPSATTFTDRSPTNRTTQSKQSTNGSNITASNSNVKNRPISTDRPIPITVARPPSLNFSMNENSKPIEEYSHYSTNYGPNGVINDERSVATTTNQSILDTLLEQYDSALEEQDEPTAVHALSEAVNHLTTLIETSGSATMEFSARIIETVVNAVCCECVPLVEGVLSQPMLFWTIYQITDENNQKMMMGSLASFSARLRNEYFFEGDNDSMNGYLNDLKRIVVQCIAFAAQNRLHNSKDHFLRYILQGIDAFIDEMLVDERAEAADVLMQWYIEYCTDIENTSSLTSSVKTWLQTSDNLQECLITFARLLDRLSETSSHTGAVNLLRKALIQISRVNPNRTQDCLELLAGDSLCYIIQSAFESDMTADDSQISEQLKVLDLSDFTSEQSEGDDRKELIPTDDELGIYSAEVGMSDKDDNTSIEYENSNKIREQVTTVSPLPVIAISPVNSSHPQLPPVLDAYGLDASTTPLKQQQLQSRQHVSPLRIYSDSQLLSNSPTQDQFDSQIHQLPHPVSANRRHRPSSVPSENGQEPRRLSASSYASRANDFLEKLLDDFRSDVTVNSVAVYKAIKIIRQSANKQTNDCTNDILEDSTVVCTPNMCIAFIEEGCAYVCDVNKAADVREDCVLLLRTLVELLPEFISEELFARVVDVLLILRNDHTPMIALSADETINRLLELYSVNIVYPSLWSAIDTNWLNGDDTIADDCPEHHDRVGLSVYNKLLRSFDEQRMVNEETRLLAILNKGLYDKRGITRKLSIDLLITLREMRGEEFIQYLVDSGYITHMHTNLIQKYMEKAVARRAASSNHVIS